MAIQPTAAGQKNNFTRNRARQEAGLGEIGTNSLTQGYAGAGEGKRTADAV